MRNYCIKIGILTFQLLIFIQPLIALESPPAFQNGFYVEGALGASLGKAGWDGVSTISAINNQGTPLMIMMDMDKSWKPDGQKSVNRMIGRAALGYQLSQGYLYLAAEVGGTFSRTYSFDLNNFKAFSLSANNLGSIQTLNASATLHDTVTLGSSEFDLDLKPGWLLKQNFLVLARIGLAVNQRSIESTGTWVNVSSSPPFFPQVTQISAQGFSREKKTAYGLRLGLGGEYLITQNIGISLNYIYTDYRGINTTSQGFASTSPFVFPTSPYFVVEGIDAPNVNISTHALLLGLLYLW